MNGPFNPNSNNLEGKIGVAEPGSGQSSTNMDELTYLNYKYNTIYINNFMYFLSFSSHSKFKIFYHGFSLNLNGWVSVKFNIRFRSICIRIRYPGSPNLVSNPLRPNQKKDNEPF